MPTSDDVRAICFYLPQFHPIPENDAWWGPGFTEWTNVTRATPRFPGHYQPHRPADLGYYDLRVPEVREAQAELARRYGIAGFCYYHYWFNGRRLLERPLAEVVASGRPDFPFCVCWANENWTRRWDGRDRDVLVQHHHSAADDRAHIRSLVPTLRDARYLRVDGRPLLLVYRLTLLPDPRATAEIWREEAHRAGLGDLFLCRIENRGYESGDPRDVGFDAAVEFQPQWYELRGRVRNPLVNRLLWRLRLAKPVIPRDSHVLPYAEYAEQQMATPEPPYLRFPGVMPSWDNSARKRTGAAIFAGSTPEAYERWLRHAVAVARRQPPGRRLVFVNAWNEWAEGTHLEPDERFGHAYLEATRRALEAPAADAAQPADERPPGMPRRDPASP